MATINGTIEGQSNLCGIVLDDGTDCTHPVPPLAPLNLCLEHFAEAARLFRSIDQHERTARACGTCGQQTEFDLPLGGTMCAMCEQRSADARGKLLLTDREQARVFSETGLTL